MGIRILSIVSSCRADGNTSRTVSLVENEIEKLAGSKNVSVSIEQIVLSRLDIGICRGCRVCFDRGEDKCPLKDDLLMVRDKMLEADGFIFASPVYVEDVNAVMKNFIDRMAFNCHRPAFAGKSALFITTSGVMSSNHTIRTMAGALSTWGGSTAGRAKFITGALMQKEAIYTKYKNLLRKSAKKLVDSLFNGKAQNPSLFSLIVFCVQQKYWQNTKGYGAEFDYDYWKNKGWLKPGCTYYIPHRASFLKLWAARFTGRAAAYFFVKQS